MRILKLSIIFILLHPLIQRADAQIVYLDPDPDQAYDIPAESLGKGPFYADDDVSVDAILVHNNFPSSGFWNVGIQPIDTNNPKVEFLYNSDLPKSPVGDYYILPLDMNQNIDATGIYAFDYPQIGDSYNSNFRDIGDKYIGFRLRSGTSFKYGWMKVNLSGTVAMAFIIKELAYQNTENTAIKAGQKFGVGIRHINMGEHAFTIFPNPAKSTLSIESHKDMELTSLRIYAIDGKCLMDLSYPEFPLQLDVSELEKGAYFVELSTTESSISRKLLMKEE